MDSGSGLDPSRKSKGGGEGKFGAFLKRVEPFLPRKDLNPIELRSWAKKTGFVSDYTGETSTSSTGNKLGELLCFDLPRVRDHQTDQVSSRQTDLDPILGRSRRSDIGSSSSRSKPGSVEEDQRIGTRKETRLRHRWRMKEAGKEVAIWKMVPLMYYGLQHYLSLAGSLVFIPLVIVPAMDGSDKDTAAVISTMLLLTGITTVLHCYFGTRLPLVQGSSFLQGAIIVGSLFQCILGSTGLMSLLLRFINPVVVAPTVAAVGLAFFSYGFPQAGTCVEISVPLIVLLLIFTLYLRGVSLFGHRIFRIYAVPLSALIVWTYAFFLTVGGAYDYKGCNADIPSSNILINELDSVGTYHAASMLVNARRPTRGVVSRGVALEGFCSLLAGIWGSGTGSTTLTENIHAINITKVASRRALAVGALFLIFFSFVGFGCFSVMLYMGTYSGSRSIESPYTQTASFRNITIVGVSMFLGLSIPAYFQQYQPLSSLILPSYYLSFGAASSGPFQTGIMQLDFAMNAVMSLNMVVTFLLAFVLDNTVPGSKEEREFMCGHEPRTWSWTLQCKLITRCQDELLSFGCRCFKSCFILSIAYRETHITCSYLILIWKKRF
ncbi:hypothetical protein Bca52824_090697 [Brassica carinata]|uniref:Nucleobase-ascorbate transporter 11 n=1 Tax=Brassica carinata TaxID=52824 RepID=A0A8X7TFW4_BRACI|nr:hypothetical protein Bca52824_090697 [Brassica carinata]